MNSVFDYIYFRIKKKFYRRDNNGIFAAMLLSMIQSVLLLEFLVVISKFFISRDLTSTYAKQIGIIGAVVCLGHFYHTYNRYYTKYWKLWDLWKNESPSVKVMKGWIVFMLILAPLIIMILIGVYL